MPGGSTLRMGRTQTSPEARFATSERDDSRLQARTTREPTTGSCCWMHQALPAIRPKVVTARFEIRWERGALSARLVCLTLLKCSGRPHAQLRALRLRLLESILPWVIVRISLCSANPLIAVSRSLTFQLSHLGLVRIPAGKGVSFPIRLCS